MMAIIDHLSNDRLQLQKRKNPSVTMKRITNGLFFFFFLLTFVMFYSYNSAQATHLPLVVPEEALPFFDHKHLSNFCNGSLVSSLLRYQLVLCSSFNEWSSTFQCFTGSLLGKNLMVNIVWKISTSQTTHEKYTLSQCIIKIKIFFWKAFRIILMD